MAAELTPFAHFPKQRFMHHKTDTSLHKKVAKYYEKKFGASLDQGVAHTKHHSNWNRRDFLRMTGLSAVGTPLLLGAQPITALGASPLLGSLANADCGDRILVLIRLKGGNDGLNMIIPRGNDEYYNIRPGLAITENNLWGLSDEYGMPNSMEVLRPFWEEGKMRVVHNVGYPEANYSHFRSSDIWASASDSETIDSTGWIGRWLERELQAFDDAPPSIPPALQIGVQTNMIFRAVGGSKALSISNPQEFYQIALNGSLYDTTSLGGGAADQELSFVRTMANRAFRYSESIRDAYNGVNNQVSYPGNDLAEEMAIIARLIKGKLGAKVYMVTIDGFDTHAGQITDHRILLNEVATAIQAFFQDLEASGHDQNVLAMTFSEFGRTIFENGSQGTDHGTGAPMLLFGKDIGQGFHGTAPDLVNVDMYGDPEFSVDFRQAYATVLQNWMCVHPEVVDHILGEAFPRVGGLLPASGPVLGNQDAGALLGHNPDPKDSSKIQLKYGLKSRGVYRLLILKPSGQIVRVLETGFKEKGSYSFSFRPSAYFLPAGQYLYRLETGGRQYSRPIYW